MQIEPQTVRFRATARLSCGLPPKAHEYSLDQNNACVLIGRLTGPTKKVDNSNGLAFHKMKLEDAPYVSSEHCLLRLVPFDFEQAQENLIKLTDRTQYFHRMPREIIREVLKYAVPSFRITIQDLNSASGTFAFLKKTEFSCGQFLFIQSMNHTEPMEIHYMHHPQHTNLYQADKRTARLVNLIKNAYCVQMNQKEKLQCLNWSHGLPIRSINRFLYSKFFLVLGFKNCAFVYVTDQPTVNFKFDQLQLQLTVVDQRNIRIIGDGCRIYSSIKQRQMGNFYEPVEIESADSIILANNNMINIDIRQEL